MWKSAFFMLAMAGTFFSGTILAADNPVHDTHQLTLQWTGLEHQKDVLQANWRRDKPVLEQQLSLLEREARELSEILEASEQEQDEVEQRRLELLQQQSRLESEQAALERSLELASIRLTGIHAQLPPPLAEAWGEDLARLNSSLLNSSEKLQLVLDLMAQLDNFQQKVTLNETIMTLDDGSEYLVKQVYLGLSHGWYVTADRSIAASGMATSNGWQWTPASDGAPIALIIDILERRANPVLVSIPMQMNTQSGGN